MNPIRSVLLTLTVCGVGLGTYASEQQVASPDGKLVAIVADGGGLHYRIEVDGQPLLKPSRLGLEFAGGVTLGPTKKRGHY